jgi:uncharacterized protein YbaR (Trm112 family)
MKKVDPFLRERLVCPTCRGELDDVPSGLRCAAEEKIYPVVDGVPHLVTELAHRESKSAR